MESSKIFKCKYCNYTSNRNYNVKMHQFNKHYNEIQKDDINSITEQTVNYSEQKVNYSEPIVNYPEQNVNYLEQTVNYSEEKVKIEEFFCKKCNKKYLTKKHLINHEIKCNGLDKLTCPKCMFHFTTIQAKSFHIKRNNCKPKSIILNSYFYNIRIMLNYIYLIKEREFIINNQNIYKIGKTKQENTKRINYYPKGSSLLIQIICLDCDKFETLLLNIFSKKFINRLDIGREYFEGNYDEMVKTITDNNK